MFLKRKNSIYKNIVAIIVLSSIVVSLGGPSISRAEEDDFPLPETFIDDPSAEAFSPNGSDGDTGDSGTGGETGDATGDTGESGVDGADSPDSDAEELLGERVSGDEGKSTDSGQAGSDGNDGYMPGLSGSHTRPGRAANVYIKTGDASAYASIINYINTTVIGSRDIDIVNIYGSTLGTLDFSNFNPNATGGDDFTSNTTKKSVGDRGNSTSALIDIDNDAELINDLALDGLSGSNRIVGANGNVVIETGDVEVDASVFNMVNTSLIGKDWNFKIINIFSDLVGDLILPTLYTEKTSAGCSGCLNSLNVTTGNTATVENAIVVNGDSGNNTITGGGSATIKTGNVSTDASAFNVINSTIIGNDWHFTKFHISGDWDGTIYNTNSTAQLLMNGHDFTVRDEFRGAELDAAEAERQRLELERKLLEVDIENNARVKNNITINANSGKNTIDGAGGNASITTGDINAKAGVTNVVNTTIIGDGWQFYLVNMFGNWKGSLHYGMPDLAVSEVAIPSATPARRGDTISYVYSYTNGGDSIATDVVLRDRFDADKVHVTDTSGGIVRGNTITWRVGHLKPRETRVLTYTTTVNAPDGVLPIQNEVRIDARNSDRDRRNNRTGGKVDIAPIPSSNTSTPGSSSAPSYYASGGTGSSNPEYHVVKASDRDSYSIGETIPFTIVIDNFKPYSGYEVGVVDRFLDASNKVVLTKVWDLGEVVGFEHIEIAYAVPIPQKAVEGPYSNEVTIYSKNRRGSIMPEVVVSLPITITPGKPVKAFTVDMLSDSHLFDMLLSDGASSSSPETTTETLTTPTTKNTTETSKTDFVIAQDTVTRGDKETDEPAVYGYAVSNHTDPGEPGSKSSPYTNTNGLASSFWINLIVWVILALIGFMLLNVYRYRRPLTVKALNLKKELKRTLKARYVSLLAKTSALKKGIKPRVDDRRTAAVHKHRPLAVHVIPLLAPAIEKLFQSLNVIDEGALVAKKKTSRSRSAGRSHNFHTKRLKV